MNTTTTNIPFVMASAFRPEYTFEENIERMESFKAHLSIMGYSKKEVCVGCWEGNMNCLSRSL